jgi:hypothetical protein
MPRISDEAMDQFDRLKRERSALDQLASQMIAFEAAMRVLAKHNLMTEFADEISMLTTG